MNKKIIQNEPCSKCGSALTNKCRINDDVFCLDCYKAASCPDCGMADRCGENGELNEYAAKDCPIVVIRRLFNYIKFFNYRSTKQPYAGISSLFDPDWMNYVAAVDAIIADNAAVIGALRKAKGNAELLSTRDIKSIYAISDIINELDNETEDGVFLPPEKKGGNK